MMNFLRSPYWRIVWIVGLFYAFFVGAMYLGQRNLMYFPSHVVLGTPGQSKLPEMRTILAATEDGLNLVAWFSPPKEKDGKIVVLFHGNAGDIAMRYYKARYLIDAGYGVYLCEYRGFGPNQGEANEEGLYKDGRAAFAWLKAQGYRPEQFIIYGESLGTGVAVEMAAEFNPAALILESAYTSTADVAKKRYFYIPVDLLMKDRFDNLSKIERIHAPLLSLHGGADYVIPLSFGKKLFEAANGPKTFMEFPEGHHNDLYMLGAGPKIIDWLGKQLKDKK